MNNIIPNRKALQSEYEENCKVRGQITRDLERYIDRIVSGHSSQLTVKGRVKEFSSFFNKYLRYLKARKNDDAPIIIPDQIGIRIVCPFIEDTASVENTINKYFEVAETERKGSGYSFKEFGYESIHILVKIPAAIGDKHKKRDGTTFTGDLAEIQVRTILQDAWAEVEHELVYKAEFYPFDAPMKRKLAAINASLSLADTIFQEIRTYQKQLNSQLGKRHNDFFKKVEDAADSFLFGQKQKIQQQLDPAHHVDTGSIDDLLLNALYAHNRGLYNEAINYYSGILKLQPDDTIAALICKHRGMAYFAQSLYENAIEDFGKSLKLDPSACKSAYYCGVVHLVMQEYAKAVDDFTISLEINTYQPFCFYRRAEAYFHLQDYPQALSDCESALSLSHELEGALQLKTMLIEKLKM